MMPPLQLKWRDYKYFPYERDFALRETRSLIGARLRASPSDVRVTAPSATREALDRLTYFARAILPGGAVVVPRQARIEASAAVSKRQGTRYSAHGLHEYRGRYNPQVVSAIANILGLPRDAHVLDPFAGSGTTLLECLHIGLSATGIDRNPLAQMIAAAKLRSMRLADGRLEEYATAITRMVSSATCDITGHDPVSKRAIEKALGPSWKDDLTDPDYLLSWFPVGVLAQTVAISRCIRRVVSRPSDRLVFHVVLSDLLREASYQDPRDLRIRRRKDCPVNVPLGGKYVDAVHDRIGRITRARAVLGRIGGQQSAIHGDARQVLGRKVHRQQPPEYDAVITSPPYETALPYVDTQRLSLVLLGLVGPSQIASEERALIGSREIGTTERRELESAIDRNTAGLPRTLIALCRDLRNAAGRGGDGFRRRARPALVYRYFVEMGDFFRALRPNVKKSAPVAMVVGCNRTTLGGVDFEIETPMLLCQLARKHGFEEEARIPMDTYPRYDMHQRNAIAAEELIILRAC